MLKPLSPGLGGTDSVSLILQVGGKLRPQMEAGVRPWIQEGLCPQQLLSGIYAGMSSPSLLQHPRATVLKPAPLLHSTAWKQAQRGRTAREWYAVRLCT